MLHLKDKLCEVTIKRIWELFLKGKDRSLIAGAVGLPMKTVERAIEQYINDMDMSEYEKLVTFYYKEREKFRRVVQKQTAEMQRNGIAVMPEVGQLIADIDAKCGAIRRVLFYAEDDIGLYEYDDLVGPSETVEASNE